MTWSDPRGVDPLFGDLDDVVDLLGRAHARGLKVLIDLVPNHSSDGHPWFQEALAAGPGSAERARYVFRDGAGPDGTEPPNNWTSVFGGTAWHRVPDGQWYLHLFAPEQPDLDWTNPEVAEDLSATLRFWLDLGVDGLRIDVAHGMAKSDGLPDMPESATGWSRRRAPAGWCGGGGERCRAGRHGRRRCRRRPGAARWHRARRPEGRSSRGGAGAAHR